jgi:hypothetical protein
MHLEMQMHVTANYLEATCKKSQLSSVQQQTRQVDKGATMILWHDAADPEADSHSERC